MTDPYGDPVTVFISDYLRAIEAGREPPQLDSLPPAERDEARELLADINTDADFEVDIPPLVEGAAARCRYRLGLRASRLSRRFGVSLPWTLAGYSGLGYVARSSLWRNRLASPPQPTPSRLRVSPE